MKTQITVLLVLMLMLVSPLALAAKKCPEPPCNVGGNGDPLQLHYLVAVYDLLTYEHDVPGENPDDDPIPCPAWPSDPCPSGLSNLYQPFDRWPTPDPFTCTDPDPVLAIAHSHMTNFSGHFERGTHGCAELTYDRTNVAGVNPIWNISFFVTRDKKTGEITSVQFQGQARASDDDPPFAYVTDPISDTEFLDVEPDFPVTDAAFYIHLHKDDIKLYKCDTARVIGKTKCNVEVGTFAVDYMEYFPNLAE